MILKFCQKILFELESFDANSLNYVYIDSILVYAAFIAEALKLVLSVQIEHKLLNSLSQNVPLKIIQNIAFIRFPMQWLFENSCNE